MSTTGARGVLSNAASMLWGSCLLALAWLIQYTIAFLAAVPSSLSSCEGGSNQHRAICEPVNVSVIADPPIALFGPITGADQRYAGGAAGAPQHQLPVLHGGS